MMTTLQLYFLGLLEICDGDQQLSKPPTLKSQSLLAYLALHRHRPQPRERLIDLFWPESPQRKARRSLSTALWHVRRVLPEDLLLSDSHSVQLDPDYNIWLDVEAFTTLATRHDIPSLQSAVTLYRGDFMNGFFDDWIIRERYRLDALLLDSLARLMALQEAGGEYPAALATAQRLLSHDLLREDAHRLAMRAYIRLGQRNAALEQYERCRQAVQQELDIAPMTETSELFQAILAGELDSEPSHSTLPMLQPASERLGRSPLDALALAPLVGREHELQQLQICWQRASTGCGDLALISGEAGIGKTRLLQEFANHLRWQQVLVLWGRCYEFERALPYQPFAEALQALPANIPPETLLQFPAWALHEVSRLAPTLIEKAGIISLLKQPIPHLPDTPGQDPDQARLFAGLNCFLTALSTRQAVLLVLEDLHWASESTIQLLHYLARHLAGQQILIVGTFRSEAVTAQQPLHSLHRQLARTGLLQPLRLSRLSASDVHTLVLEMSAAQEAVRPLSQRLYDETEGNPFFLIEIIKALFEDEQIRLQNDVWQGDFLRLSRGDLPLPASLQEAIQARAGRLPQAAQQALGLAAVIGRQFDFDVLNLAWTQGEEYTLEALEDLLRSRMIEETSHAEDADFAFTHHKIQEVSYISLPRRRRLHWHVRVGTVMEELYAGGSDGHAGELAHHFEQASLLSLPQNNPWMDKAIHYLLQAGQQAVRHSANQEAVAYYRRGLALLHTLPETLRPVDREIELQAALATPIAAIHGYAAPETRKVYERARSLAQKLEQNTLTQGLFIALVGLSRHYGITGDSQTSKELSQQIMMIAHQAGDADWLLEANRCMGGSLFISGRFVEANECWKAGWAYHDRSQHPDHAYRYGHDPCVSCLIYSSITFWLLGCPEQSQKQRQTLIQLLPTLQQPSSLAFGHCMLSKQACLRQDATDAQAHAETALQISQTYGLSSWTALATGLHGWALFEQGQITEGLAQLSEGITRWRATGFYHLTTFLLALQAEAFLKLNRIERAAAPISDALTIAQRGERYWMPELYRLQGELLRIGGGQEQAAEAQFFHALDVARQQQAKMLELRAAQDLAQLWLNQQRTEAVRQLLETVYQSFPERSETQELHATKALLAALA